MSADLLEREQSVVLTASVEPVAQGTETGMDSQVVVQPAQQDR
jgi:hypothetical protein